MKEGFAIERFVFRTAGETHGPGLVTIVEGVPAGLPVLAADIDRELARRQVGYGRGERMRRCSCGTATG